MLIELDNSSESEPLLIALSEFYGHLFSDLLWLDVETAEDIRAVALPCRQVSGTCGQHKESKSQS